MIIDNNGVVTKLELDRDFHKTSTGKFLLQSKTTDLEEGFQIHSSKYIQPSWVEGFMDLKSLTLIFSYIEVIGLDSMTPKLFECFLQVPLPNQILQSKCIWIEIPPQIPEGFKMTQRITISEG